MFNDMAETIEQELEGNNPTGYTSILHDLLYEQVERRSLDRILDGKMTGLDLGAGPGLTIPIFEEAINQMWGIEYNPRIVEEGKKILNKISENEETSHSYADRLIHGSFLTQEHIAHLNQKFSHLVERNKREHLVLEPSDQNPYKVIGKELQEFDFIYRFTYPSDIPIIMRVFEMFGNRDATLLIASGTSIDSIHMNLRYLRRLELHHSDVSVKMSNIGGVNGIKSSTMYNWYYIKKRY